jgi:putative intracellular protease/amidase
VRSFEGYNILPDITLNDLDLDVVDAFVIPGGNPDHIINKDLLYDVLRKLDEKKVVIGAICAGVVQLSLAGIIKEREFTTSVELDDFKDIEKTLIRNKNVVISENLITAKATGYVEFGLKLGKLLDVYEDEADYRETVDFYMNFGIDG